MALFAIFTTCTKNKSVTRKYPVYTNIYATITSEVFTTDRAKEKMEFWNTKMLGKVGVDLENFRPLIAQPEWGTFRTR